VIALAGLLLVGGTGVALTLRTRPRPVVARADAGPAVAAGPTLALTSGAPSHAFERLPEHIQRDLLEIGDILKGMDE
jgi:hypothetical protein